MHQQLHETTGDAGFDNGLDLVVRSVGEVGDGPAGIDQDFIVKHVYQLGQDRKSREDLFVDCQHSRIKITISMATYRNPVGLGSLATAEVAESPGGIAEHAELATIADQLQKRAESTGSEDVVTALWAVTGNVTKSPHGLLADIGLGTAQELDENRDSASFNDNLGLLGRTGGNVGQGPRSLKLDEGVGRAEELDEAGDDAGLDDLLNGGVPLLGEEFSEFRGGRDLEFDLVGEDALDHLWEFDIELDENSCQPRTGEVLGV